MGRTGFSVDPEVVAAVAKVARKEPVNVSRLCRKHKISRDTFYRYLKRFADEGNDAFTHRSSVPHHSPTRLSATVAEKVLRTRKELDEEGRDNGPISILWRLEDEGFQPLPSRTAIYRVLCAHGVIIAEPRKKPRSRRRFEYAKPNECWQLDGTDHHLAGGETVCILQILDDHSRFDVGTYAATSENARDTVAAMHRAITEHGAPVRLLTDNGLAFSGKRRGYMVEVERYVATHGTMSIPSSVKHPQTCGKDERSHRTLQKWLDKQPRAATLDELQHQLDRYRHMYNHDRRHQGIGGLTPHQRYTATPKAAPPPPGSRTAASGRAQRAISATGVVAFSGRSIVVSRRYAGQTADLFWQGDRVTVMVGEHIATQLTLNRSVRYQRLNNQNCP